MPPVRHTPYYHKYLELGASLSDRPGYIVAMTFTTIEEEHQVTREAAGLYDVYAQGPIDVKGRDAHKLLNSLLVNDLDRIEDGGVMYSSLVNEQGGMLDDLTCYRLSGDHYWLVSTPSRLPTNEAWVRDHAQGMCAHVTNCVSGTAYLSVQGPASRDILGKLTDADLSTAALPYYHLVQTTVAEVPTLVSRTGYSGELGYELYYPREYAEYMWDTLMTAGADHGMKPAGLAALMSTRVEKKYPVFGGDLSEANTPIEANLGWTVRKSKKSNYVGRDVLERQKEEGVARLLVGIELPDLSYLPVRGDTLSIDEREIGSVTTANKGFTLGKSIALGYVSSEAAVHGAQVTLRSAADGTSYPGVVHTRALWDPEMTRVRG